MKLAPIDTDELRSYGYSIPLPTGYSYGRDATENVRLGAKLATDALIARMSDTLARLSLTAEEIRAIGETVKGDTISHPPTYLEIEAFKNGRSAATRAILAALAGEPPRQTSIQRAYYSQPIRPHREAD